MKDLKAAVGAALKSTPVGVGLETSRQGESVGRLRQLHRPSGDIALECADTESSGRLVRFDVFIWDQCYAMEQSLRID
ncbi:MAG: hypothetical protein M3461_08090 [Pseudomonadota bacterium]|nr:hypothetical protein [Pseudomonadota bacterium]